MRILQLVQKPQRRGAEVFASQLSAWARSKGETVRTVYLYSHCHERALPSLPTDVLLNAAEDHPFESVLQFNPTLLLGIAKATREFEPDIVQLNGARSVKYGALLATIERRRSWKLVYRNIDSPSFWVTGRARRRVIRSFIMPRMDGIIAVSKSTLEELTQLYRPRGRTTFIPNGVDFSPLAKWYGNGAATREELATPAEATVVLFVGHLSAQKRPDRLVRVFHSAAKKDDALVAWVLGDGPARETLEADLTRLGLRERIRFLGYREEVGRYMAAADIYLSTSDTEGIPAVVLEAGYMGLPTLGMRVGGMHECVIHGETGYLVDPGDEASLADRVVELAANAAAREALGQNARRWCEANFSIQRVGHMYLDFFEALRRG